MNESNHRYDTLLDILVKTADEAECLEAIERNLTKLDYKFENWLLERAEWLEATEHETAARLREIRGLIYHVATTSDYRMAQFDEDNPSTLIEVLLALARQVERGEIDLVSAVDRGTDALSSDSESIQFLDWRQLVDNLLYTQDWARYVPLAELMYQIGQQIPELSSLPDYTLAVNARDAQARELLHQREFEAALQVYERIVAIAKENKRDNILCASFVNVAYIYEACLEPSAHPQHLIQAEHYYRQALKVSQRETPDPALRANILMGLGETLVRQGKLKIGIGYLEESSKLYRSLDSTQSQQRFNCLKSLGQAYKDSGNYDTAAARFQAAIPFAPDIQAQVICLGQLGDVLQHMDAHAAYKVYAEAAHLADSLVEQGNGHDLRSQVYGGLGICCTRIGKPQASIDAYIEAIESSRRADDQQSEARWLANLAQVYLLLGQLEQAESLLGQAAEVHIRLDDDLAVANLALTRGHVLLSLGDWSGSAYLWASAYVFFHRLKRLNDMFLATLYLSLVYLKREELSQAEACVRHALSHFESVEEPRLRCYALQMLGRVKAKNNDVEEASAIYQQVINLNQQIGEFLLEPNLRLEWGKVLELDLAQLRKAEAEYRKAIELQEQIRGNIRTIQQRIQIQSRLEEAYELLINLLVKQHKRTDAIKEAFSYAERARSRTLVEQLSRTPVRQPASLRQPLALRESELLAQILNLEEVGEVGLEAAQRHAQLNRELEEIWQGIANIDEACSDYVDLRRALTVDLKQIHELLRN